jgi:hypothetical protein
MCKLTRILKVKKKIRKIKNKKKNKNMRQRKRFTQDKNPREKKFIYPNLKCAIKSWATNITIKKKTRGRMTEKKTKVVK